MNRQELMNDLWADEPITVTLRSGIEVKGTVHSRNKSTRHTTIIEDVQGDGVACTIADTDIERIVLEDVEWRHRGG